ncbi:MAG: hypothetical protein IPI67_16530 [Myxococcales bacterium]|nr:hypothetical protein [Myxococcales bacterium]
MDWSRLATVALVSALGGCASDAVDAPEPTLETPGAFVAQEVHPQELHLLRVLGALHLENGQTILLMRRFAARPSTFEAARELAKQPDLAIDLGLTSAVESEFVTLPYRVVWFRTLNEQERDALH